MQSIVQPAAPPFPLQNDIFSRMWRTSRVLTGAAILHSALIVVAAAGVLLDPQMVLNEPAWIKPLKFSISIAIYCATISWMLSYIQKPRWLVNTIATGTAFLLTVELGLIILQAVRGVRSHFNQTTPLDSTLYAFMGSLIMTLWILNLVLVVLLLFQRFEQPLLKWSLIWGIVIAILGGLTGLAMTEQLTPAQQAALEAGIQPDHEGGHTFGGEDGGAGLPLVGWSTEHGDVRVAHFIGLHGLQIMPLLGLTINRSYGRRLSQNRRLGLLFLAGAGYLGLMATTFQQAVRGYSIISFDPLSVLIGIGLAGILAGGWYGIVRLDD